MNRRIVREIVTLGMKSASAPALSHLGVKLRAPYPSVTLFVICTNNREPVELTLRSLRATTRYPDYRLVVADNASTDGSLEFLRGLSHEWGFELIESAKPREHHEWCDDVFAKVQTDYWVHVHDDMLFLASDWLADMIGLMERHRDAHMLCRKTQMVAGFREPYGSLIDLDESLVTCLFCTRTSLRARVQTSFAFWSGDTDPRTGRRRCYDTGGRLMADMAQMDVGVMDIPKWHMAKWHHFGNLSWGRHFEQPEAYRRLKEYQCAYIARRVRSWDR